MGDHVDTQTEKDISYDVHLKYYQTVSIIFYHNDLEFYFHQKLQRHYIYFYIRLLQAYLMRFGHLLQDLI